MRRLVRWTLNALTVLSLLLCVATAGLWVRSRSLRLECHPAVGQHHFYVVLTKDHVAVGRLPRALWENVPVVKQAFDRDGWPMPLPNREARAIQTRLQLQRLQAVYQFRGRTDRDGYPLALVVGLNAAAAALLVVLTWRRYQAASRRVRGRCLICSYDLTGNVSGVCPECGTAIVKG